MVSFTVTAELVSCTGAFTWNGTTTELSVPLPIVETVTADTLVSAKQQARQAVNLKALLQMQTLVTQTGALPTYTNYLYKGRTGLETAVWVSVNITKVVVVN